MCQPLAFAGEMYVLGTLAKSLLPRRKCKEIDVSSLYKVGILSQKKSIASTHLKR